MGSPVFISLACGTVYGCTNGGDMDSIIVFFLITALGIDHLCPSEMEGDLGSR